MFFSFAATDSVGINCLVESPATTEHLAAVRSPQIMPNSSLKYTET